MDVKLEPHLQRKLEQNVINSTMKQNVDLMSKIADQCFNECVNHFPSRMLSKGESKCIENCADRFIVLSQRVGKQYQEVQHQVVVKENLKQMEEFMLYKSRFSGHITEGFIESQAAIRVQVNTKVQVELNYYSNNK